MKMTQKNTSYTKRGNRVFKKIESSRTWYFLKTVLGTRYYFPLSPVLSESKTLADQIDAYSLIHPMNDVVKHFRPNGRRIVGENNKIPTFDWKTGELRNELQIKGKSDGPFNALRFLEDGILVGHTEILHSASELAFWKVDQAEPIHSIKNGSGYDLSLHPDKRQLLVPTYVTGGSSGNGGRGMTPENYLPNTTRLRVFSLYAKPEEPKKG